MNSMSHDLNNNVITSCTARVKIYIAGALGVVSYRQSEVGLFFIAYYLLPWVFLSEYIK